MADYKAYIPHIFKWEGGWSSDPTDTTPLKTNKIYKGHPVHTNKGITFQTWLSTAKELGHPKDENSFLYMTESQWGKIMKKFYWDYVWGDQINSQRIAELLTEIVWGSGGGELRPNVILLQKYLKDKGFDPGRIDGYMGNRTVTALNGFLSKSGSSGEKEIIDLIFNNRKKQLASYPTAWKHLKGWMNRMNDWYNNASDRIKQYIKDNPQGGILGTAFLVFGALVLAKKFIK